MGVSWACNLLILTFLLDCFPKSEAASNEASLSSIKRAWRVLTLGTIFQGTSRGWNGTHTIFSCGSGVAGGPDLGGQCSGKESALGTDRPYLRQRPCFH